MIRELQQFIERNWQVDQESRQHLSPGECYHQEAKPQNNQEQNSEVISLAAEAIAMDR